MVRIVQLAHRDGARRVAVVSEPHLRLLNNCSSVYELVQRALDTSQPLRTCLQRLESGEQIAYDDVYESRSDWTLLPPIDHHEPSRCLVTGTGLTHKASAENRQSMHVAAGDVSHVGPPSRGGLGSDARLASPTTDSMKMFQIGLDFGRPEPGKVGAAPEWFYKGTGTIVRSHNQPLTVPAHGFDGGEEAEIAGIYLIGADGTPFRIGLAQGNEFSDHVLEAKNYLYLAPSKLRDCALGPELIIDPEFNDVPGRTAIERNGKVIWQAAQASGERYMCHTLENLEHHHFKHAEHRRPGDVHIHFFGADMFSFKDRLRLQDGDMMSISFEGFGRPLRNPIRIDRSQEKLVVVKPL